MKIYLRPVLEFYITNHCNLSCSNCNRFNDHDFQGHYRWQDHEEDYLLWAQRIDAEQITILGGEPTLNPGLEDWVKNIRAAWPDTPIMIQTNGVNNFHLQRQRFWEEYQVGFGVAAHANTMRDKLDRKWNKHQFDANPSVFAAYKFTTSALIAHQGRFKVHNSDPDAAFDCCTMKHSHTLFQGRLYKCPLGAVLPEFVRQHTVDLDHEQQELLAAYKSIAADCSDEELQDFVATRDQSIPQCALCPGRIDWQPVVLRPRPRMKATD